MTEARYFLGLFRAPIHLKCSQACNGRGFGATHWRRIPACRAITVGSARLTKACGYEIFNSGPVVYNGDGRGYERSSTDDREQV